MPFLIDAQLPPALARFLTTNGHVAMHVADLGMQTAPDNAIWDYALRHGAVIISKDEDFAQRHNLTGSGPAIIWIRLPNTRRRDLLTWFDSVLPEILRALERGETLIEVA